MVINELKLSFSCFAEVEYDLERRIHVLAGHSLRPVLPCRRICIATHTTIAQEMRRQYHGIITLKDDLFARSFTGACFEGTFRKEMTATLHYLFPTERAQSGKKILAITSPSTTRTAGCSTIIVFCSGFISAKKILTRFHLSFSPA